MKFTDEQRSTRESPGGPIVCVAEGCEQYFWVEPGCPIFVFEQIAAEMGWRKSEKDDLIWVCKEHRGVIDAVERHMEGARVGN